jgi:hypothetical protein
VPACLFVRARTQTVNFSSSRLIPAFTEVDAHKLRDFAYPILLSSSSPTHGKMLHQVDCVRCCRLLYKSTCMSMSRLGKRGCTVLVLVLSKTIRDARETDKQADLRWLVFSVVVCDSSRIRAGLFDLCMHAPMSVRMLQPRFPMRTYMVLDQALSSSSCRRAVWPPGLDLSARTEVQPGCA